MKAEQLIMRQIEADLEEADKPYSQVDHRDLQLHQDWLCSWLKDSQHDCLRARGDSRWLKASELHNRTERALMPF